MAEGDLAAQVSGPSFRTFLYVGLSRNEPEESLTTDTGGRDHDAEVDRLALLRHAGEALATALDIDAALGRLAEVLVPALADWFSLDLLEGGTITNVLVMHPHPERVQLAKELQRRFPSDPDAPTGSPHVIRTGESELTEEITDEMLRAFIDDPELLTLIRELQLRCAMVVPLTARGRTIGSITMIGAETHERYGPADLRLAEEIADRAALAIDTARLLEAENRARLTAVEEARRSAILQGSTAAFGSAVTVDDVVSAMLDEGIRRAGAIAGTVGILEDDGRVILRGLTGYQATDEPYWSEFRIEEPLPLAEAIQQRRPIVLSTTEQRDELYPALAGRGEQRDHALVCVPLVLGDDVVGGFSASYPPGLAFGDSDLSLLLSIGEQCAQAVDPAPAREAGVPAPAPLDPRAAAAPALARPRGGGAGGGGRGSTPWPPRRGRSRGRSTSTPRSPRRCGSRPSTSAATRASCDSIATRSWWKRERLRSTYRRAVTSWTSSIVPVNRESSRSSLPGRRARTGSS